ncbi:TPA: hypothetical protein RQJ13_001769 [Campylobacter fetus subsp. venerealis]|nr:hypothetical protein [Campylobacter fetus subsp. venerealis]HDX6287835.1 hypothetical protein [Campylobacter fetus subsp. venerealis]HDX6289829.1 hypothetical protein [Campylobacter fetus subsp. venerealis]HDX6305698.1 hypothetical protein [Campylobacter fetus subsp. venerealis]HDX8149121.1 hypothetical protein [Campylobacter fetus subsp. venerealis]
MQVLINIENANKNIINALRAVLKTQPELKFEIKETKKSWSDECKELIEDYKANKIKSYKDPKKMHQDILNG